LALAKSSPSSIAEEATQHGRDWLIGAQLPDGSWPAQVGQPEGCWVTSLACLALQALRAAPEGVSRGVVNLCNTWSREGSLWWRFHRRFLVRKKIARQNDSLRGWSWTAGTSSWVEPTAYALILLRTVAAECHPSTAVRRRRLGEAMLYDRVCPGGGWNSGNPVVYGVPGEPQVGPTVWALLALQDYRHRTENRESLNWLLRVYENIQGPGSLALAHICLEAYGQAAPAVEAALQRSYSTNRFLENVQVVAWATLALLPGPDCLRWS